MDAADANESYITAGATFIDSGDERDEKHNGGDDSGEEHEGGPLREQDRFLPIANVARIMKKSVPNSGKIAKDAKECLQECVSEFISFITSEASERCHQEKRKTINGEDILFAMNTLSFDNYVEPLKIYLQKFREANKTERTVLGGQAEGMVELADDSYGALSALSGAIISTDSSTPHIIYTGDYGTPVQIQAGQLHFN